MSEPVFKILFLDIDGVFHTPCRGSFDKSNYIFQLIDDILTNKNSKLIIVWNTSWSEIDRMRNRPVLPSHVFHMFSKYENQIIDINPYHRFLCTKLDSCCRGDIVDFFLNELRIKADGNDYLIIDDLDLGYTNHPNIGDYINFINTGARRKSSETYFNEEDYKKAKEILNV